MKTKLGSLAAAFGIAFAPMALALASGGVEGQVTKLDVTAANRGQGLVATKIASSFTTLAGSKDNSLALVNALRTGSTVELATTTTTPGTGGAPDTVTTTTTSFDPPTGRMGWGNVKISLALAQDVLARAGITEPTAEQLQVALLGGDLVVVNADGTTTTTALDGILTQRASGMGWGEIAQANGTKVGPVLRQLRMANTRVSSIPPDIDDPAAGKSLAKAASGAGVTTAAGAAANAGGKGKGITTAAGGNAGANGKGKGLTTAAGTAAGPRADKGITTAAGGAANAGARGHGKGITTGAGVGTFVGGSGKGQGAGITTAMGGGGASHAPKGNAFGRGIVTAGGGGGGNVAAAIGGKPSGAGAGVVTAGGSSAAAIGNAGGGNAGGQGKGHGRGGKPGG